MITRLPVLVEDDVCSLEFCGQHENEELRDDFIWQLIHSVEWVEGDALGPLNIQLAKDGRPDEAHTCKHCLPAMHQLHLSEIPEVAADFDDVGGDAHRVKALVPRHGAIKIRRCFEERHRSTHLHLLLHCWNRRTLRPRLRAHTVAARSCWSIECQKCLCKLIQWVGLLRSLICLVDSTSLGCTGQACQNEGNSAHGKKDEQSVTDSTTKSKL
mmetsp:Transcript_138296/g.251805  ORF Transcript_138296/g.251805 Transcript_138296/m.251805 type:complete len:213 (-) Transcript_138296:10-648(-)